ncbi:hypothetical protein Tdes44962_MAKER07858 [Teratosphaeria destructans]|uniref:AB hydrolase-1 domain-containing protein n=1 Tax=Teratosphaeria destructans TaxID=418781 RepID=A0A9W7SY62_9PEZI|nr:hypothetical protein Tdes44962_MAKER07858 [Teratosphaeria destructans]
MGHGLSSASALPDNMLNQSTRELVFIRTVILLLHSIGPLCAAYTATLLRRLLLQFFPLRETDVNSKISQIYHERQWAELAPLQGYCIAETGFYLFFLWYRTHLQREAIHPPLRSKTEREALFKKIRSGIRDPKKFLKGWFRGAEVEDIGKDDLREFLLWAFWENRADIGDKAELEELVLEVENMVGHEFKPGRGAAKGLRLTLDPIEMECRSLLWYAIIMLVDTMTHIRMLFSGFKYFSTLQTSLEVFPPRPLALATATQDSPAQQLSYWYREHTSKIRLPVLFLHGIGIGLHAHVEFLRELDAALNSKAAADNKVGILAVEVLQISSRLTHSIVTSKAFLEQLAQVLDHHRMNKVVLVSHSYGSVFSTHILTDPVMSKRISSTLLIDPVTILLHMPDVAYNFTVRTPVHANEWQLWYFAAKDPLIAHTLGRHFFWSENLLWRDRIMELVGSGVRVTASLARRDLIVDTEAVAAYLMEGEVPDAVVVQDMTNRESGRKHVELDGNHDEKHRDAMRDGSQAWKKRKWTGQGLEVLWWDDLDHAQVFDERGTRAELIDVIVQYCKSAKGITRIPY